MSTLRDYEYGDRPACAACGCELDPETDCHHDGYMGSPYAHNGRGSYGLGSHHYVFSDYCESCASRPAPLVAVMRREWHKEWLACGHYHSPATNRWGHQTSADRRRCEKCKQHAERDFSPLALPYLQKRDLLRRKIAAQLEPSFKCGLTFEQWKQRKHVSERNADNFVSRLFESFDLSKEEFGFIQRPGNWHTAKSIKLAVGLTVRDEVYNNDNH